MTDSRPGARDTTEDAVPTVLVVDDDRDLADTYGLWLEEYYDVRVAHGGEAALEIADDDVDVVLLDRRMPGVAGDEVLAELRDRGLDCQVSMLTAIEPDSDLVDMPFDEYLVKPVSKSEVRETVEELLVRSSFDEQAQDLFAVDATERALSRRDGEAFSDPEAVAAFQDEAEASREETELAEYRAQLDRLTAINALIRDVERALVHASTRGEIEATVCERLVEFEDYDCAWIGEYTAAFERVTPGTAAGIDADAFDDDHVAATDGGERTPVADALEDGGVRVVEPVADGPAAVTAPLAGSETDFADRACAVVPVTFRSVVYGGLFVYGATGAAFGEKERDVLADLGLSVGGAINAVESRNLVHGDTVVELEFELSDRTDALVDLSAALGCVIEYEGVVPAADDAVTAYLAVSETEAEAFVDAAGEHAAIDRARVVDDRGDSVLVEATISGAAVVRNISDLGASLHALSVEGGTGHVTVDVAPSVDVRTVVEALTDSFPDLGLVAKRERERSIQSSQDFRTAVEEELTERQRTVFRAAYESGYFDWPRGSTAEEVAEALDIAAPTLHEHLRSAQRSLAGAYFEQVDR